MMERTDDRLSCISNQLKSSTHTMNMDILHHHVNTEAGTETTHSYSQLVFELAKVPPHHILTHQKPVKLQISMAHCCCRIPFVQNVNNHPKSA